MKSKLLKDSKSSIRHIEELAGKKSRPISKSTKRKIELASRMAWERIKHNNNIYLESSAEQSNIILGGPTLTRKK